MKKRSKIIFTIFSTVVLCFLGFVYHIGAWNILFPSHKHETVSPIVPDIIAKPSILLFTKTNGFRHRDAIEIGASLCQNLSQKHGWSIFPTENSAVFNDAELAKFDVVIFHNVTGNVLSSKQQKAFEKWLPGGGGWLGIHAAGDGSNKNWSWYQDNLIGAEFIGHIMGPQFQTAKIVNERTEHPVMTSVPTEWNHEEEWYSWDESVRDKGFSVLASVDKASYNPKIQFLWQDKNIRMEDHPIIWTNCVGKGRTLHSTLGHSSAAYDNVVHIRLLENALVWLISSDETNCKSK